jgi:hypothetical protein
MVATAQPKEANMSVVLIAIGGALAGFGIGFALADTGFPGRRRMGPEASLRAHRTVI